MDDDMFDLFSSPIPDYEEFARTNERIVKQYGNLIMRSAFDEIVAFLSSTKERAIPDDVFKQRINATLKADRIQVLNAEEIVSSIMKYLEPYFGYTIDSMDYHYEEGRKVLWPILARYVDDPARYIDSLFKDITRHFSNQRHISVMDTANVVVSYKRYADLPEEAVVYAVDALFDFFVEKGFIAT